MQREGVVVMCTSFGPLYRERFYLQVTWSIPVSWLISPTAWLKGGLPAQSPRHLPPAGVLWKPKWCKF